jgi:hypothetical protein
MNQNDRAKLIEVLSGVHDFYGKDLTPFALQVWELACRQFDVEQVTKALSAHLMDAERYAVEKYSTKTNNIEILR